ncbi:hypothetical protein EP18_10865 [Lysinibacillus sphaericus]|nr:dihydroorotase [Lysinibacillus sphaericus]KEK11652.1 hypothetical protein EP18_10865 [Lysinibacillus sphaericus]
MNQFEVVIQGYLVLPEKVVEGEIGVQNGKIVAISEGIGHLQATKIVNVLGKYVFPGLIDAHVHCFSNPDEGFEVTSAAAAAGGVTTFLDMPYDLPNPINNVEIFKEKVERLNKQSIVDICLWGTISKYNGVEQIKPLAEAGAVAFKMSTFETDAYRFPRIPDYEIIKAMEQLREYDLVAAFHAENDEIIVELIEDYQKAGKVYPKAHMETRPPYTETSAVLKLMEFAHWTDSKLHIVHVSHPRTLELIKLFKEQGTKVTSETCYTYLLLNCGDLDKFGPKAKNNPPLRYQEDVDGLWEKIKTNDLDFVTSDHAPWSLAHKEKGKDNIFLAASGMPGLDIMGSLMFERMVVEKGFSLVNFAKVMAQNPADIYGIPNKGRIAEGFDADFAIIDPEVVWTVDENQFHSYSKISPFHGQKVKGKVVHTIVRGETVYDGEKVTKEPGFGVFVPGKAYKQ